MSYAFVFKDIFLHQTYLKGIAYGKPRRGHQEGSVAQHIVELEKNLCRIADLVSPTEYWKLMILIHVHDTFKAWAKRDAPIDHHNSHATLAKQFLADMLMAREIEDEDLLRMIQWHDENFALWKQMKRIGKYDEERLRSRIGTIEDLELFLFFTKDGA